VDYQKAHEIGRQLADSVTKGQNEYVLTTHIGKGRIPSRENGYKLQIIQRKP